MTKSWTQAVTMNTQIVLLIAKISVFNCQKMIIEHKCYLSPICVFCDRKLLSWPSEMYFCLKNCVHGRCLPGPSLIHPSCQSVFAEERVHWKGVLNSALRSLSYVQPTHSALSSCLLTFPQRCSILACHR